MSVDHASAVAAPWRPRDKTCRSDGRRWRSWTSPDRRTPRLPSASTSDEVKSLHIRARAMRSIAVLTAAVLATVVSPANAEKLKLRCESPLVPSASSTLYIDEVNGRITQIWDSTGYEDTSPATFKEGVWRWLGWRTRESDGVIDISLDRRTGEIFGTTPSGKLLPLGPFCR